MICQKGKLTEEMSALARRNGVAVKTVEAKKDFIAMRGEISAGIAVMYDFGVIIPKEVADDMPVFNFHPGSIRSNRGSSPIHWSVLLQERTTEMSLYKISEKIDLGVLIATRPCEVSEDDTPKSLRKKLESSIPDLLLELNTFLEGKIKGEPIETGEYRRRIEEKDFTIDLARDSIGKIKAKIQSQKEYKGAVLFSDGKKYFIKEMEDLNHFIDISSGE